jgi:glycosyltransferase 2 family protein
MNRKFRLFFSVALLILMGILLSQAVKIEDLQKIIWDFPKEQLMLFMGLSIAISLLKAWRFLLLLHNSKIPISFWDTSKLYIASQTTTPLPGGETLRGYLVQQETSIPAIRTAGPIITQAFLEIGSAISLVMIGSLLLEGDLMIPALILTILLIVICILLLNQKIFLFLLSHLPKKSNKSHIKKFLYSLRSKLKIIHTGLLININDPHHSLLKMFTVSIGIHFLGGLLVFAISKSFNAHIDFPTALLVYTAGIVIQGLSIVPGGIGLTEGGMTGILVLADVELGNAVAIVLIFRMVTLIYNVLIGLVFFALFYAKNIIFKLQPANN